ncbi:MAG: PxKF domain-containing protein [bacterium]|nr:PxKF domain-containing protein [bacterium]
MGLIVSSVAMTASATKYDYAVPYINQLTDTKIGESACGPTSIAMILNYYYPKSDPSSLVGLKEVYGSGLQGFTYYEEPTTHIKGPAIGFKLVSFANNNQGLKDVEADYRKYYAENYIPESEQFSGMRGSEYGSRYLNQIWGGESSGFFKGEATMADIIKEIKKRPLILSVSHAYTTGHFIVLRGYDEGDKPGTSDDKFYINDPYPNWRVWDPDFPDPNNGEVSYATLYSWINGKRNMITFNPELSDFQRKYTVVVDTNKVQLDDIGKISETTKEYIWKTYYGALGNWNYTIESGHWAKWIPSLITDGDGYYDINAVFYDNNVGDDVEYVIYNKGDVEIGKVTVKQENTGNWRTVNLGTYYLTKAQEPYVKINDVPVGFNIDTVRFERIHGLQASYYNEPIYRNNLETVAKPDALRIDPNLNFAWHINPSQRPVEIINDGWWSGDWKGYIKIDEPGTYRFRLTSDDGSWLYIDGAMLINNGGDHSPRGLEQDLELEKGYHSILVKYFESYGGEAVLKLEWKAPGKSAFVPIPLDALYVSVPKEQLAILKVSKKAPAAMSPGSEMTYTLYYQNFGGAYDSQAVLEDKLPIEVDFVSASGGKVPNAEKVISWNIDSVAAFPQGLGSKTVTVRINPDKVMAGTTVIENTATIKYGDQSFETKAVTQVVKSNLPESVTVDNTRNNIGGETSVFWQDPITFNYYSSCAESVAINIHMNEGGSDISGAMTETEDNKWSYTVPKFAPNHGSATVTYTVTGCEKASVNFNIYIDPAGFVYDAATGARISGASVWLQQPDGFGGWNNVSIAEIPARMQPNENPLITNADGQYQWDVLEGIYRIHVEAAGYYSADSIVVNIPPPVFDLNVGLVRIEVPDSIAPNTTLVLSGTLGNNSWFTSDVQVNFTATDNEGGTGVNTTEYSFDNITWNIFTTAFNMSSEGIAMIYYRSVDNAGNTEPIKNQTVKIDKTAPEITVATPVNGSYVLNQSVIAIWAANDLISGIASATATVLNGTPIDTATIGTKNFSVNATDNAGNQGTKNLTYNVVYNYSGLLPPINANGSSFKLGSTIPIKFQLWNAGGNNISTAIARIYLTNITNGIIGTEINGTSTSNSTTGNLFRYDSIANQYIFNLATKPLTIGTWQIRIELDDGTSRYATIGLKK